VPSIKGTEYAFEVTFLGGTASDGLCFEAGCFKDGYFKNFEMFQLNFVDFVPLFFGQMPILAI